MFDWRRWFKKKEDDNVQDNVEKSGQNTTVSIFKMVSILKSIMFWLIQLIWLKLQFSDRLDIFLIIASILLRLVGTLGVIATIIVFGKVTGSFASESFVGNCPGQDQYAIDTIKKNITCPLGIELNPSNFAHLHK